MTQAQMASEERLERLLGYLAVDPDNQSLMADAASAAIEARQPEQAVALLDRIGAGRELNDAELHLLGLAALQSADHQRASAIFRSLLDGGSDAPPIRFNLAWALSQNGAGEEALAILDEASVEQLPQAAMLAIQLHHANGSLKEAEAVARVAAERHANHPGLMAAVSVLAIDIEDVDLARTAARAAGGHPDALTTLGTLALEEDPAEARRLFDRALEQSPRVPRARVGRGLALLAIGEHARAAQEIDRGADMFGNHLGSIIAAGWAHFTAHDLASARDRFQRAHDLDPTFAEAHGALAVIDLLEGREVDARQRTDVALRLDRACFSAALAQVLMRAATGDTEGASKIFERAIHMPIDESGRTVAQALARNSINR